MISLLEQLDSPVRVRLAGSVHQTSENGFHALVVYVEPTGDCMPDWWPREAHISFGYRYNQQFSSEEVSRVTRKVERLPKEADLVVARVADASGHYSTWHHGYVCEQILL
tara:strand:+ start:4003 stop:4332 length:330 start_codon:yes stop_codon:yes gene_type:complete